MNNNEIDEKKELTSEEVFENYIKKYYKGYDKNITKELEQKDKPIELEEEPIPLKKPKKGLFNRKRKKDSGFDINSITDIQFPSNDSFDQSFGETNFVSEVPYELTPDIQENEPIIEETIKNIEPEVSEEPISDIQEEYVKDFPQVLAEDEIKLNIEDDIEPDQKLPRKSKKVFKFLKKKGKNLYEVETENLYEDFNPAIEEVKEEIIIEPISEVESETTFVSEELIEEPISEMQPNEDFISENENINEDSIKINNDNELEESNENNVFQEEFIEDDSSNELINETIIKEKKPFNKKIIIIPLIVIIVLGILGVLFLFLKDNFLEDGVLEGLSFKAPNIIYVNEKEEIIVTAMGTGNLRRTKISFDMSENDIVTLDHRGAKGKNVKNNIIATSTGRFIISANAKLNAVTTDYIEKEIVVCKRLTDKVSTNVKIEQGKTIKLNLDLGDDPECFAGLVIEAVDNQELEVLTDYQIKGLKVGVNKLKLTQNNKTVEIDIEVLEKVIPLKALTLSKKAIEVVINAEEELAVVYNPENATIKDIIWKSSNEGIATVDNGIIKGIKKGTVTITATSSDGLLNASATVYIVEKKGDSAPPVVNSLSGKSNNSNSGFAKSDDTITVNIEFSKNLADVPTITISGSTAIVSGSGTKYTATSKVKSNMRDGKISVTVSNYKDVLGNKGSSKTNSISVTIDKTAPKCSLKMSGNNINISGSDTNGIRGYQITRSKTKPTSGYGSTTSIAKNGTGMYYGYVIDPAGNIGSCSLDNASVEPSNATQASCFTYSGGTISAYKCYSGNPHGLPTITNVIIPRKINSSTITTIGHSAFASKGLTSITIPNTITSIGTLAFNDNKLTSVTIPNSIVTIGDHSFSSNKLTSVSLGSSVRTIAGSAFARNQLTSITLPTSLTTIGNYVFDSNKLISVTIPRNVTSIGRMAFYKSASSNSGLTSITNTTGRAFDWYSIVNGQSNSSFITGPISNNNVTIK